MVLDLVCFLQPTNEQVLYDSQSDGFYIFVFHSSSRRVAADIDESAQVRTERAQGQLQTRKKIQPGKGLRRSDVGRRRKQATQNKLSLVMCFICFLLS